MTRLRESTKNAEKQVWPAVRDALAAQATPVVIDRLVSTKQARSNVRFVVEQTIQAIAAAGLLRTPVDADVIGKAIGFYEAEEMFDNEEDQDLLDERQDDVDLTLTELYDAVGKLRDELSTDPTD